MVEDLLYTSRAAGGAMGYKSGTRRPDTRHRDLTLQARTAPSSPLRAIANVDICASSCFSPQLLPVQPPPKVPPAPHAGPGFQGSFCCASSSGASPSHCALVRARHGKSMAFLRSISVGLLVGKGCWPPSAASCYFKCSLCSFDSPRSPLRSGPQAEGSRWATAPV